MLISAGTSIYKEDFEFSRDQNFPYWTFSFFHKGSSKWSSGGHHYHAQPYDLKCIRPHTAYHTQHNDQHTSSQSDWILGSLGSEWEAIIDWAQITPGVFLINLADCNDKDTLKQDFHNALQYTLSDAPYAALQAQHALESVLLGCQQHHQKAHPRIDPRIIPAIEMLSDNFERYLDVSILAEKTQLSASRFAHLFRQELGQSPMRYREGMRMKQTQQLLIGSSMNIQEISVELAYDNPFHFSTRFKQHSGLSPSEFRRKINTPGFLEKHV